MNQERLAQALEILKGPRNPFEDYKDRAFGLMPSSKSHIHALRDAGGRDSLIMPALVTGNPENGSVRWESFKNREVHVRSFFKNLLPEFF